MMDTLGGPNSLHLFITILSALLLLFWVLLPLLQSGTGGSLDDALFHERARALLHALDELGKGEKKVTEDDRANIQNRLILELAKMYHARGIPPNQLLAEAAPQEGAAGERETAAEGHAFCTGCGKPRERSYQFCPFCGNQFKAA